MGLNGACSKHAFVMKGTSCMCCVNDITPLGLDETGFAADYDLYTFDCDYSLTPELTGSHDDCDESEPCGGVEKAVCLEGDVHFHRKDVEGLFYGPGEMSVRDLDGDCCEDVVVSHETGGQNLMGNDVQWYRNDCAGNFSQGKTVAHDDCPARRGTLRFGANR